jgi:hypothetical protein
MTKIFSHVWKVWLRLNHLTQDIDNDYIGEVSTTGDTLHNEDIASRIVKERSELRYETIVSILHERDNIVFEALLEGSSVKDRVARMAPGVTGVWIGTDRTVNPQKQRPVINISPTAELREALTHVKLEVLGVKESTAFIGLVTDVATKAVDGHITPNGIMLVTGDRLRIAPENDPSTGVFFISETGARIPVTQISQNDPKKLTVLVPQLSVGSYTLEIVTRFTNGHILLKEPRTITYSMPLLVE